MIYSICQLNKLMQCGTMHPLLTVIDEPAMFDCDECDFHVIIFRKNKSREDERFGRSANDFRAATISFHPAGRRLDLTDCQGIIAFDNEYFDHIADEFPFFHFNEHESLHISDRDLQKWQKIAFMLKEELQESIDDTTKHLLRDGLHALLDLANRFYKHQIILREKQYNNVSHCVGQMISTYYFSHKRMPSAAAMAKSMKMSKAFLDEVMKVMTGMDVATYCKVWKNNMHPTLASIHLAV